MKKMIMLTTVGRRSGERRTVTLYGFPDKDALVVVGSWAGRPRDPAWALNLRDEPRATVTDGKKEIAVRAREVKGKGRARLWELVCDDFPMYRSYQSKTTRQIPLFILEPV